MAAYRTMTRALRALSAPLVVGVDTNTWADPPLGVEDPTPDPDWAPEQQFVARAPAHGLVDAYRAVVDRDPARAALLRVMRPYGPLAATYIRRPHARPRGIVQAEGIAYGLDRMDRIYASADIEVVACESFYHEAVDAGGDHALVLSEMSFVQDGSRRS